MRRGPIGHLVVPELLNRVALPLHVEHRPESLEKRSAVRDRVASVAGPLQVPGVTPRVEVEGKPTWRRVAVTLPGELVLPLACDHAVRREFEAPVRRVGRLDRELADVLAFVVELTLDAPGSDEISH